MYKLFIIWAHTNLWLFFQFSIIISANIYQDNGWHIELYIYEGGNTVFASHFLNPAPLLTHLESTEEAEFYVVLEIKSPLTCLK